MVGKGLKHCMRSAIKSRLKKHKAYSSLAVMKQFFQIMGVRPIHIVLPVALSLIAAFFEGVSLGLMVPLARGLATSAFGFARDFQGLKQIIAAFPQFFSNTTTPNRNIFLLIIGLIFISTILKNLTMYFNSVISAYWHGIFNRNIYKYIFDRLLSFGKMFFDITSQGYINTVISYLVFIMKMLTFFETSVNRFFTLIVYFAIMFIISWKLTIITMFIFPVLYYSLKLAIDKLQKIADLKNLSWMELYRKVFNILTCIPLIKAYSKEKETKRDYDRINEEIRILDLKATKIQRLVEPMQDVIVTTFLLFMVSIVALLLAENKPAEISVYVVFFYAARRSLPMFNIFNDIKTQLAQAKPPLKEIAKLFDDTNKFFVSEGDKTLDLLQNGIEFKHLTYSYNGARTILKDVSFFIEKGKTTAIVGPSGAGKTTLVSLIIRFYDCPAGSILIDGCDIRDVSLKSLRSHIAFVSQEAIILNDTLKNNMIFGLDREVTEEELIDISKKARLYDLIAQLPDALDTEVGDRGIKLSGGEKQRLAIARALLKKSEILILDEATSSLDSKTEILIREAIDEAVKDRTAIVIAHRLSTIKNANKIVVIEDGRIMEEGTLQELLGKKDKFYGYWEAQKFY